MRPKRDSRKDYVPPGEGFLMLFVIPPGVGFMLLNPGKGSLLFFHSLGKEVYSPSLTQLRLSRMKLNFKRDYTFLMFTESQGSVQKIDDKC